MGSLWAARLLFCLCILARFDEPVDSATLQQLKVEVEVRLLIVFSMLSLAFSAQAAPRSAKLKVRVESPQVLEGGIDEAKVRRRVRSRTQTFINCYQRHVKGKAARSGSLLLRFDVLGSGRVDALSVVNTELGDALGECLVKRLRALRMPTPEKRQSAVFEIGVKYRRIFEGREVPRRR